MDITARLLEGNNGDRESLVYRTVIQVNRFRVRIDHDFTLLTQDIRLYLDGSQVAGPDYLCIPEHFR